MVPSTPANKRKLEEALVLMADGMSLAQAARAVNTRHSTLRLWTDPEYATHAQHLQRERVKRYGKPCKHCGKLTSGGDGRAHAPDYCKDCYAFNPLIQAAKRRQLKWTKDSILQAIQRWHLLYGDTPSGTDWNPTLARKRGQILRAERWEKGNFPWFSQVFREFGSWNAAIEAAGFEPRRSGGFSENIERRFTHSKEWTGQERERSQRRPRRRKKRNPMMTATGPVKFWTRERILAKFHEFNEQHGRPPTSTEWLHRVPIVDGRRIWPSSTAVITEFGSWSRGMRAAGYTPRAQKKLLKHESTPRAKHWTKEEIIQLLQKWHAEHGLSPARNEWERDREYPHPSTVTKHFGSWSDAIRAAGFLPLPTGVNRRAIATYLPLKKEVS